MSLTPEQLNDVDDLILDVLADGRATPTLVQKSLAADDHEFSRQYVNMRMKRLAEHDHIENLFDTGVYELVDDPR
ncbi:hypothetical protein KM295_11620 [Natronomonas sp. F2-12]|jgi:hypothetical protein|uniref:Uncharacterized protein n=1 Tax=Natronomonas aquatica TaxID=2841590 RepID=A0A9R1CV13_9EURY|nr:hypothetical protein [Natronomonas aquatica]MCQ4334116.1 hypothetical protein [Natronomonas aquatica]